MRRRAASSFAGCCSAASRSVSFLRIRPSSNWTSKASLKLQQEREYAALQESASISRKKPASRTERNPQRIVSGVSFRSIWSVGTSSSNPMRLPAGEQTHRGGDHRTAGIQARRALYPPFDTSQVCLARTARGSSSGSVAVAYRFPRANAGPSLLAQLLVGKYQDHLPLHRQIVIFARAGVQLKASTVS